MLRANELGPLAFKLVNEVHITPINYAVDHQTLLVPDGEGRQAAERDPGSEGAFEIDEASARSVAVRGKSRLLGEDEAHRAEHVPLRPRVGARKRSVVEIVSASMTGRSFAMSGTTVLPTPP